MAKKKPEDEGGAEITDAPIQSQEVREAILQKSAGGLGTATGTIHANEFGEKEIPSGEDRGSKVPIAGNFEGGDSWEGAKPQGAQAQPSLVAVNGTVPVNMIGTPSGPVPISAVESDPARGATLIQERLDRDEKELLRAGYSKLSRAKVESMSGAELRAVASDRGYDVGEQGNRTTRTKFLKAQNEDKALKDESDEGTPAGGEEA